MVACLRIGCSSWTSDAWWGKVYPQTVKPGDRLSLYARKYDSVEVDSSYYRDPGAFLVKRWAAATPEDFLFTLKVPQDLLDPRIPLDTGKWAFFLDHARLLGRKLGALLLQFPPWFRPGKAFPFLEGLLSNLDPTLRYAVELRDAGWYGGSVWDRLRKELGDRNIALTWSYLTYVTIPPELTTDFVYVRFIGDHVAVPAETHGEIRIDRSSELRTWAERVRSAQDRTQNIYVFFNNHFQGFAPESVNQFRQALGMEPVDYLHGTFK